MIVDIEDDIMDPVMQCTTLPSHSGFSQKKLVSFVTEIHMVILLTISIQFVNIGIGKVQLKNSLFGEDSVDFIITYVKQECNKYRACWSRAQVDQESQIKMIQVKEMMQDNDLKNSTSEDRGLRSRSQSMNDQSHYKQDKTITRQSINVNRHIFNVIGGTENL
ncbi:hypothetical protein Tco_0123605 [Tanacetum coccineum]